MNENDVETNSLSGEELVEMWEIVIARLRLDLLNEKIANTKTLIEYEEYKAAMEWCFGEGCQMALDKYRKEVIKKDNE